MLEIFLNLLVPARFIDQKNPLGLLKALMEIEDIKVSWYGEVFEEYPIYKKVVTTFPSISNENLFTEFPLQEGVTANPRTFLNSNSQNDSC